MSTVPISRSSTPRFAVVSAVYNVSRYLTDFIDSIERQTHPLVDVEVMMVDDGSTDDSLSRLRAWERRRPDLVRVLTKENGGQASARNLGAAKVTAEWVTFLDPDDTIAPDYFAQVAAFLDGNAKTTMVATNRIVVPEITGKELRHPLHRHFAGPDRLRDLERFPSSFHGSAPSAFFRVSALREQGLEFDERVRPNFEDGHYCSRYLLAQHPPLVGFLSSAKYYYRKRADLTSTLDSSRADRRRFTDVLEFGYLDALERARSQGEVPGWLQNFILYELSWYFQDESTGTGRESAAVGEVAERFHELLARIVTYLEPEFIQGFSLRRFDSAWRDALLHSYATEPWHTPFVRVDQLDTRQRLVRVRYRFTGEPPAEEFYSGGRLVTPSFAKVRAIRYFDRVMLNERIVWLPLGSIRVRLNGALVVVNPQDPPHPTFTATTAAIRRALDPSEEDTQIGAMQKPLTRAERSVLRLARSGPVRRRFANAWVLIDRIADADDSAEHLFRYLRRREPDINAWFVVKSGTRDWDRLRKAGYRRLIPYGSLLWKLLMLNCEHLISSHADVPITRPPEMMRLSEKTWRTTFLQHGVIKDDLSDWLNPKQFDLFITSTPAEHASVVADGTSYTYTEREVKLTGLPRFDRLRSAARRVPEERRNLILIAPTWRNWLEVLDAISRKRRVSPQLFAASDFGQNWMGLIRSPRLRELATRNGCELGVLLHPNLQPLTQTLDVPAGIQKFTFDDGDVRELFARARVLVTDYSSMAFNVAYLNRPVVYFQFDAERVMAGGHLGRRGYFDYQSDGFGPVATSLEGALTALHETLESGPEPRAVYAERIASSFPHRDGKCCERVVKEIKKSTRRVKPRPAIKA